MQNRPKPKRSEALQRHHDFYTKLLVTDQPHSDDLKQAEIALERRLDGKVNHLVDAKIVIDP